MRRVGGALALALLGGSIAAPLGTGAREPDMRSCGPAYAPPWQSVLDRARDVVTLEGVFNERVRPDTAPGRTFDARAAVIERTETIRWGAFDLSGQDPDMVWVGGHAESGRRARASWATHKANDDPDDPGRNSAAFTIRSPSATLLGFSARNVHDGIRIEDYPDWTIEGVRLTYVRDDAIENDSLTSGILRDSLLDGVYVVMSTRPGRGKDIDGSQSTITLERVLARLELQPYPFKWRTKPGTVRVDGVPHGHGNLFKMYTEHPEWNPRFRILDSTFMIDNASHASRFDFPPDHLIAECRDVSIVYTGPGRYPGRLPTGDCVEVTKDRRVWERRRDAWLRRHGDVEHDGTDRFD